MQCRADYLKRTLNVFQTLLLLSYNGFANQLTGLSETVPHTTATRREWNQLMKHLKWRHSYSVA